MPNFGTVNAKKLIEEGNRATRPKLYIPKKDALAARKMTGFILTRQVSDRKARDLAAMYKKEGIIKTHKTAWKIWHDAKKRELEAGMKEEKQGEKKMTTADLRRKMDKELKKRTASARLMEDIHGKKTEEKKPVWGIDRSSAKHSAFTKANVTVERPRAQVSALDNRQDATSPSAQSVSSPKKSDSGTAIELQI